MAVRNGNSHRADTDEFQARVARAAVLVHLGELSAAAGQESRQRQQAGLSRPEKREFRRQGLIRESRATCRVRQCFERSVSTRRQGRGDEHSGWRGAAARPSSTTCAHFLTTSLTASSCTALPKCLCKQTCQGRLLRHCVLAGWWLCKSQMARDMT